jgi:putative ABC transport system substrate-binding protein
MYTKVKSQPARIILILALAFSILLVPFISSSQPRARVARIGFMSGSNPASAGEFIKVFSDTLRERGWIEGQNVQIEYRYAEGQLERFSEFAAELVALKADVIFAPSTAATLAAKQATSTIPVVFHVYADPVGLGLVASMARPGGNMTGLSVISDEISAKRLEYPQSAWNC